MHLFEMKGSARGTRLFEIMQVYLLEIPAIPAIMLIPENPINKPRYS